MFEFVSNLKAGEEAVISESDLIMLFCGRSLLLDGKKLPGWCDVQHFLPDAVEYVLVGMLDEKRCFAAEISGISIENSGLQEFPVRQFLFEYPDDHQQALCRGKSILHWRKQHRFCGVCRSELLPSEHDSGVYCPECGAVFYPQISPAVIVAVTRNEGRELLLAHNRSFAGNMYSLLAGFVESGETVEECVHREIFEECGIQVKNLTYLDSQMWPFPNSLMLAFQAEYLSGQAVPDGEELSDLGWFTAENHPQLPAPGSIARKVIDRIFS